MTVWQYIGPLAQPSQPRPADLWMKKITFRIYLLKWNSNHKYPFVRKDDILSIWPLISFMFRAFSAFAALDMFLYWTNANPRIFPSITEKHCYKIKVILLYRCEVHAFWSDKLLLTGFQGNFSLKNWSKFGTNLFQIILWALLKQERSQLLKCPPFCLWFPCSPLHLKTEIPDDEPCFENVFPDTFRFILVFLLFFSKSFMRKISLLDIEYVIPWIWLFTYPISSSRVFFSLTHIA